MNIVSRLKKVIRNILIIAIIFFLFLNLTGLYLSPLSAHENSERGFHYGPSEVVHIEDFDKGKYILGKYDQWISCNTVTRYLFFLWSSGSQVIGFENTKNKPIEYTWSMSEGTLKLYGIINDERIQKIEFELNNGLTGTNTQFYNDLFLYVWDLDHDEFWNTINIWGYDANDNLIYEEVY